MIAIRLLPACVAALLACQLDAQGMNAGALCGHGAVHRMAFPKVDREIRDTVIIHGRAHTFILDTGAPLCISVELQQQEHFPVIHTAHLVDANGREDSTRIVLVDTVHVGDFVFCGIPAVVLDLAHSPLGREGITGIIGSNLLRFLLVRFDAAQHEVLLSEEGHAVGFDEQLARPGVLDGQSNLLLPLRIGGCYTDTVQVDSGMGEALVIGTDVGDHLLAACPNAVERTGTRRNRMAGTLGRDRTTVDHFRTGSVTLGDGDLSGPLEFTGSGGGSRIGRALLARGVFILDYPHARFSFVPGGQ